MRSRKLFTTMLVVGVLGWTGVGLVHAEADKGPEKIIMKPTVDSPKKPEVTFMHRVHQDKIKIACGECHHSAEGGKQVPYKEGQKIENCASCHNAQKMPAQKDGKDNELATLKGAGHGNCVSCHKKKASEDPVLKEKGIDKCQNCHGK
ncbi:MAG: hypothetical protein BWK76_13365 [Desulfobulbaceae bacterium A2]|nr:MAG: hypothetical protein BWK76_13365 [Desulfobulbaceae bacterium A2]